MMSAPCLVAIVGAIHLAAGVVFFAASSNMRTPCRIVFASCANMTLLPF